jgi:hypothetical protein
LLSQLGKHPFFLGASNDNVFATLNGLLETASLAAAQGGVKG